MAWSMEHGAVRKKRFKDVQPSLSTVDVDSSDEEIPHSKEILQNVTDAYSQYNAKEQWANEGVSRSIHHLEQTLQGGVTSCLICLCSVKRKHAMWSCEQCYSFFHLPCIQQWARDSLEMGTGPTRDIAVVKPVKYEWKCPKCRLSYSKDNIPNRYMCYCGAETDPVAHDWVFPHSCGSSCNKLLKPECGHKCLLLCHPGPCPPCPRQVEAWCHCRKSHTKQIRCINKSWSCTNICGKQLPCGQHACPHLCHPGDCPECEEHVAMTCQCGRETKFLPCMTKLWQCEQVCTTELSCGYHKCGLKCHPEGDCRRCPISRVTRCPCGAENVKVECPDVAPLCGGTCNRLRLSCQHRCPEQCHHGGCPPCLLVVDKQCECGAKKKTMPCSKKFKCVTKCQKKVCHNHVCGRRCCTGCTRCERVCGNTLSCGKHKCASVCHTGPCYPCPQQTRVSCSCGGTFIMVNCGKKRVRMPQCHLPCKKKYVCGHEDANPHQCHIGDCPPCEVECDSVHSCGHKCDKQCHKSVKVVMQQSVTPATPMELRAPRVKVMEMPCPPCMVPMELKCDGGHQPIPMPCHFAETTYCDLPCKRLKSCTRHECGLQCHPDTSDCQPCEQLCMLPRDCHHACVVGKCHAGSCPPCPHIINMLCYCSSRLMPIACSDKPRADSDDGTLSCNQRCHKAMDCGHRCTYQCHPGPCSDSSACAKLVKANCPCHNYKQEIFCRERQKAKVECVEECYRKKELVEAEAAREEERRRRIEEDENKRAMELYQWRFTKKVKRKREAAGPPPPASHFTLPRIAAAVVAFVVLVVALLFINFRDDYTD